MVEASTKKNALLDMVVSNNSELISEVQNKVNISNREHIAITFKVSSSKGSHVGTTRTLNLKKCIRKLSYIT